MVKIILSFLLRIIPFIYFVIQAMYDVELLAPSPGKQGVVYRELLGARQWRAQGEDVVDLELKWSAYH